MLPPTARSGSGRLVASVAAMDVRATYRVQLHRGFTFDDVAGASARLADLGFSHVYCSPYQESVPGSTHGYDVVDPTRVSTERGGEAGLRRMAAALRAVGMGHIVDIVPNHMASDLTHNHWWRDVLEHGRASRWAPVFDIDWAHLEPSRRSQRLVLPILGDHYGRVVDGGGLSLSRQGGDLAVAYGDLSLPLSPPSAAGLLAGVGQLEKSRPLVDLAEEMGALAELHRPDSSPVRHTLAGILDGEPALARALDVHLVAVSADPVALHEVLRRQHYRLAFWRVAAQELDYRRFFDVNDLVAVRVEDPYVFEVTHSLIGRLVGEGILDGVRVDHVDGLRDPGGYLRQLRNLIGPDAYLVVEKILDRDESLPAWPVAGTTGYDFCNDVGGLFVDPAGEPGLTELYASFAEDHATFPAVAVEARQEVLAETLAADVNRLVDRLAEIRDLNYRAQDFTRRDLRDAIRALASSFRVYRTYLRTGSGPRSDDVDLLEAAISDALALGVEAELLGFLRDVLLRRLPGRPVTDIALRFQQLTGATMAKGVEDTAFYRYLRLVALNEVGGDPSRFGRSVEDFHRANQARAERWPSGLLTTSTHDTKRGEDTRMRIAVLSEIPDTWARTVHRWSSLAAAHRRNAGPDRRDEYLVYQTLVGTWPIGTERLVAYVEKAAREAKRRTTWTEPDAAYEAALGDFVAGILADEDFRAAVDEFVSMVEGPAQVNSLAQAALRLTAPGVPDTYQGCEVWSLSLVDPDNRSPVDHAALATLARTVNEAGAAGIGKLTEEGGPKMWLTAKCLEVRNLHPEPFGPGSDYEPLETEGSLRSHVVGYLRSANPARRVAVVVARLVAGLGGDWADTRVALPAGTWVNHLDGTTTTSTGDGTSEGGPGGVEVAGLLGSFPVAVLVEQ